MARTIGSSILLGCFLLGAGSLAHANPTWPQEGDFVFPRATTATPAATRGGDKAKQADAAAKPAATWPQEGDFVFPRGSVTTSVSQRAPQAQRAAKLRGR